MYNRLFKSTELFLVEGALSTLLGEWEGHVCKLANVSWSRVLEWGGLHVKALSLLCMVSVGAIRVSYYWGMQFCKLTATFLIGLLTVIFFFASCPEDEFTYLSNQL